MLLRKIILLYGKTDGLDPDVQSFVNDANITDETEIFALQYLVSTFKSTALWGKMDVIYPFVGGSASSHSYNLKDVTTNQISWNGTVTHNSNGITGDGVTGYGDTGFIIPSANQNNLHMSIYHRNDINTGTSIGSLGAANVSFIIIPNDSSSYISRSNTASGGGTANTSSNAYFLSSRNNSSEAKSYKNGALFLTDATVTGVPSLFPIYLLGRNNNGTADYFSASNLSFATIGSSLTDQQSLVMYNTIQQYQTILGRQV